MRSVAQDLTDETRRRVQALSAGERLDLALALGDADVDLYRAAHGLAADQARRRLRAGRHVGRQPSVCSEIDR